jgi:glycosyltransferase involved in cell wall biosynthesis
MRIAIFAPVFVRPTETFIYDATRELIAAGNDVEIIAEECPLEPNDRPAAAHVVAPPGRWDPKRLLKRLARPLLGTPPGGEAAAIQRAEIRRILHRFEPEVIIANYGQSGVLLAPLAKDMKLPLVVSFHGFDASQLGRDSMWQDRFRKMFETAAAATGPSEYVRQKLIRLGCPPERAHVLHYGIRTDRIQYVPVRRQQADETVKFLFVGRLAEKKDPMSLLKSFQLAVSELGTDGAILTMVGDGPLREKVHDCIAELGIGDAVRLLGRQTHEQVIEHMRDAHIYVQHSVTAPNGDEEGLPVSITEALASGLPVISTRHSGIPEAVREDECGLLVDEKDVDGMSQAMVRLARDPDLCNQFGAAGRELLEKEFSTPVVQKRLRSILENAAALLA